MRWSRYTAIVIRRILFTLPLAFSTGCEQNPAEPLEPVVVPTVQTDADSLLANYRANLQPLSTDWIGIGKWTPERASRESSEAALLEQHRQGGSQSVWAKLGRIYTEVGEVGRGLCFLCKALDANSDDIESWVILGNNRQSAFKPEEALCMYERAIELNRDHTFAWARRGESLLSIGAVEAAEQAFKEAILLSPRNIVAQMGLAQLYEQSDRFELARGHLERALREDTDEPVALFRLARVLDQLELGDQADAVRIRHERAAILDDKRLRTLDLPVAMKYLAVGDYFLVDGRSLDAVREYQNAAKFARDDDHRIRAITGLLYAEKSGQTELDRAQLERDLSALAPDHELLKQ
ncbi:MAG: tetratricopeptide (TPR) repeat protein [Planctomycetota bacterium]|jgi:tetratricopeptide (TPR) repeat protein